MLSRLRLSFCLPVRALVLQVRLRRAKTKLRRTQTALAERDDQLAAAHEQIGRLTASINRLDYDAEIALCNLMAMAGLRNEANEARAWADELAAKLAEAQKAQLG
jgi:hypothetical protein